MNPELFKQARRIFLEACKLPIAERKDFIDQACVDLDEGVRREVEDMLAQDRTPTISPQVVAPTNTPTIGSAPRKFPDLQAGEHIGPYVIRDMLGEGGFAIVYLAEQKEPVRRRVALKIIKAGMDSREVMARFDAERQALALMDHPSVAKVLDAGTTEAGRPYFVMEHVAGVPITEHCDRQRLDIDERLQIFMQVCRAVQHAHQKGIIHRDLKPSNILVATGDDTHGTPKVIDFGVAKALNQQLSADTIFTVQGQFIGTPEYMSPEQAEMSAQDIDTRSDIYSLGVLLYELLTGALPFDAKSLRQAALGEIQRIIREEEPSKPSTKLSTLGDESTTHAKRRRVDTRALVREIRGDLDWIVMKCLEKDRTRRYETANGLAQDLERHLHDEPVEAGPPSVSYRFNKFIHRNKGPVTAVAAVMVALAIGLVTASWFARVAEIRRVQAVAAKQNLQGILGQMLDLDRKIETVGPTEARQYLLEEMLPRLEALADSTLEDRALQLQLASMYDSMGDLLGSPRLGNLGDTDEALRFYEKALLIRTTLVEAGEDNEALHNSILNSNLRIGDIHKTQGHANDARAYFQTVVDACRKRPRALKNEMKRKLAVSLLQLADVVRQSGDPTCASLYQESVRLRQELLDDIPRSVPANDRRRTNATRDLAQGYVRLAVMHDDSGNADQAAEVYDQVLELRQGVLRLLPDSPVLQRSVIVSHVFIGDLEFRRGNLEDALDHSGMAVSLARERVEADPSDTRSAKHLLYGANLHARILESLGRSDEALAESQVSIERAELLVSEHPEIKDLRLLLAESQGIAAAIHFEAERFDEARRHVEASVAEYRQVVTSDPTDIRQQGPLAQSLTLLASIYLALDLHESAVDAAGQACDAWPDATAAMYRIWAEALHLTGDDKKAAEAGEAALARLGPDEDDATMQLRNEIAAELRRYRSGVDGSSE